VTNSWGKTSRQFALEGLAALVMSGAMSSEAAAAAARAKNVNLGKATNFMRQYRDPHSRKLNKLSANQFMEVWSHYDKDGNGYIECTELYGFLENFVSRQMLGTSV
jgi:hypothetical protein